MTSTTGAEGTEDVNDFLLRIRELGERRDKEDEERTKKLEEEILKGRQERQARRAGIVASPMFPVSAVAVAMTQWTPVLVPECQSQKLIEPPLGASMQSGPDPYRRQKTPLLYLIPLG